MAPSDLAVDAHPVIDLLRSARVGGHTAPPGGNAVYLSATSLARGLSLAIALITVACGGVPASANPASAPLVSHTSPIASPGAHPSLSTVPSTTETAWGRIWDSLPPSFPRYPGSEPAETGAGPASATLAIDARASDAADWLQSALERAGYSTKGRPAPLEDGSIVIDSAGTSPGCAVQTTLAPHGGTTIETVMFGAACPFR